MNASEHPEDLYDVAIVGMAGRFPGAEDVDQLWSLLVDGVEAIRDLEEADLIEAGVPRELYEDPAYVRRGAWLDDVDCFDAELFGISPREAEILDPQHRLVLETAWAALEDAACDPERFDGLIGIYGGVFFSTYLIYNLLDNERLVRSMGEVAIRHANDKDYFATRVSYKLGLRGPAISVQTSCSTSLVAAHLACQALINRECDLALVGGASIYVPQKTGYLYRQGGIQSPDGRCRAFDARAGGTVFGSGVALVALERLADAVARGRRIYAVIKGTAINNDGSERVSYTAPGVTGQAEVIAEALAVAQVEPRSVGYVETHGTATSLGDPIEIAALTQAFRDRTEDVGFCALGSVKTNVGHLNTASGVTGLIKTALMLHHRTIPPSLHFEEPNPEIDLAASPFYVATSTRPWRADGAPRRAGLSSFGMGGTNAHAVLEEAPASAAAVPSRRPWHLMVLSAKTPPALDRLTARMAAHLEGHPELDAADVAFTLQVGRRALDHRRFLVCRDRAQAAAALASQDRARLPTGRAESGERPIAFLFPGQGAQYVGMGRQLYETEPSFRTTVDTCSEILRPSLGLDLRDLLYPAASAAGSDDSLTRTAHAQPALFVVEYALARLLGEWGIVPQTMIGHSVGELVAACVAGVFGLEDALGLVALRGRLMESMPAGSMLAVPLSEEEVRPRLGDGLELAAVNAPQRSVVAGPDGRVAELEKALRAEGVSGRRLHTSHAFHSAMMGPVLDPFREAVAAVPRHPPTTPFVSNLSGAVVGDDEARDPDYWARQLRGTVRFADGVETLAREAEWIFLEVGPGRALSSLVRHVDGVALATMRHARGSKEDGQVLLEALGRLWVEGVEVDWERYHGDEPRRRLGLPGYPFERRRFWADSSRTRFRASVASSFSEDEAPSQRRDDNPPRSWLMLDDHGGWGRDLARRLEDGGAKVFRAVAGTSFERHGAGRFTVRPESIEDFASVLRELDTKEPPTRHIVHLWSLNDETPADDGWIRAGELHLQSRGLSGLHGICRALGAASDRGSSRLYVIANGAVAVAETEPLRPEAALLLAATRALSQKLPGIDCLYLDVAGSATGVARERLLDLLQAELAGERREPVVALRGARRWVQRLEPLPSAPAEAALDGIGPSALPAHPRPDLKVAYEAPTNDLERRVAEVFRVHLGVEAVGIDDGFFDLGGDSLLATQIVSGLQREFHVELPLARLFDAPTVREIAVAISEQQAERAGGEAVSALLAEIKGLSPQEAQELLAGEKR